MRHALNVAWRHCEIAVESLEGMAIDVGTWRLWSWESSSHCHPNQIRSLVPLQWPLTGSEGVDLNRLDRNSARRSIVVVIVRDNRRWLEASSCPRRAHYLASPIRKSLKASACRLVGMSWSERRGENMKGGLCGECWHNGQVSVLHNRCRVKLWGRCKVMDDLMQGSQELMIEGGCTGHRLEPS